MKEIKKAIQKWAKKHKGNVAFVASFVSFDKKNEVKDDSLWFSYGNKKTIDCLVDCLKKDINKITSK